MLRRQGRELVPPEGGDDVQSDKLRVAVVRLGTHGGLDDILKPAIKELGYGLTLDYDRDALLVIPQRHLKLFGHFPARGTVDVLAAPFAVLVPEIHTRHPPAVTLPPVYGPLVMTALRHCPCLPSRGLAQVGLYTLVPCQSCGSRPSHATNR